MPTADSTQTANTNLQDHPGHSTGPRTPEGKARVAQNAMKEGYTCLTLYVPPGMEEEFEIFSTPLLHAVKPVGALEERIFEDYIRAEWSMYRVQLAQNDLAASGIDPLLADNREAHRLENIYQRHRGARNSALTRLTNLQSSRMVEETLPSTEPPRPPLAKSSDSLQLAKQTQPLALLRAKRREAANLGGPLPPNPAPKRAPASYSDFITDEEKENRDHHR
jgi:hypothetical protein